jgi:L-lactate dehydrogenase (cytochrome)/(S)-mandelate dehydrogenase
VIAARVGDRLTVILDGGVRRGTDVVKALCLGAEAVMIGRPALYGLASTGQSGVEGVLEILRAELETTMVLMGVATVADLDRTHLLPA